MGEVAPLGDGEGQKNIKFHYFFGQSRTPVPTIYGFRASAVERTYFVGVGALDDPKSNQLLQYKRRTHYVLKNLPFGSFLSHFFSKKWQNKKRSTTAKRWSSPLCALKIYIV